MIKLLRQVLHGPPLRTVDQYQAQVKQINDRCARFMHFDDADFPALANSLRNKIGTDGPKPSHILEAYSLVKAACRRVLGIEVHNVQLLGALAMHEGSVADMKTGEGKTITAIFPAFLNAVAGKKVHIATVNEYLAARDSAEMGRVFAFLGLSAGCVRSGMSTPERQAQYAKDVTYATYFELGFDFLRDHLVHRKEDRVQCGLDFLLLDEADSILIDEARTPLLISSVPGKGSEYLVLIDQKVAELSEGDYEFDASERHISLTHQGIDRCEALFNVKNLMNPEHTDLYHKIQQAMRARHLLKRDIDYVVRPNEQGEAEVVIVDPGTGRLMFGRRYIDGLHQAIEAKERVNVNGQSATLASITLQHFIFLYEKVGGMSGTAAEVAAELQEVYGLEVALIPTHRPIARIDHEDLLFFNEETKHRWIIEDVKRRHAVGQPVLVGTPNIRASEQLSRSLREEGVPHHVLNAKNAEEEADIIRRAGEMHAVTIATNMAGRGVDIRLGPGVEAAGGLHVIGTCRHASARIDNQLRGRSGRQGAVGSSRFYVSLEDELMVNHYPESLLDELEESPMSVERPIKRRKYVKAVRQAQRAAESESFAIRSKLLEWDKPVQQQRMIFYRLRDEWVDLDSCREAVHAMIAETVEEAAKRHVSPDPDENPPNWIRLCADLGSIFPSTRSVQLKDLDVLTREETIERLISHFARTFDEWYDADPTRTEELATLATLRSFDRNWVQYLEALNEAKESSFYTYGGYGSPQLEYAYETGKMFERLLATIRHEALRSIWKRLDRINTS